MKNAKPKYSLGFQLEMILWVLVYSILLYIIDYKLEEEFGYLLKEDAVAQSVKMYWNNIIIIFVVTIILSVIWWGMSLAKFEIRRNFEEKTLLLAVLFLLVLAFFIIYLNLNNPGIIDDLGNVYNLNYAYYFIGGFMINLLAFPPRNVQLVICPGPFAVRLILVAIMGVVFGTIVFF